MSTFSTTPSTPAPKLGDVVHFVGPDRECCAAIVTGPFVVDVESANRPNLFIMLDAPIVVSRWRTLRSFVMHDFYGRALSVIHDETAKASETWHRRETCPDRR